MDPVSAFFAAALFCSMNVNISASRSRSRSMRRYVTVTVHIMVPPAAYIPTYTLIIHVGLRHSGSDLDTVL